MSVVYGCYCCQVRSGHMGQHLEGDYVCVCVFVLPLGYGAFV